MDPKLSQIDESSRKIIQAVLGQSRDVLNSFDLSQLAEPWLSHFNKIKSDYDSALKDLAPSDQVVASLDANRHLSCLYTLLAGANSLCSFVSGQMSEMKKAHATALNSAADAAITAKIQSGELIAKADLDGKIKAAIDARIAGGELLTKESHTQLCSAAKEIGRTEGKTAAETVIANEKAKLATLETRRGLVQTASLPVPSADIEKLLGGTDEEFNTRMETAKSRVQELMAAGIALNAANPAWDNVWKGDGEYKNFKALAIDLKGEGAEPFASRSGGEAPMGAMLV